MQNQPINWSLVDQLRAQNPIVLTLANSVTIAKVADSISAVGGSPIMSVEPAEAAELVKFADAITINLGTINQHQLRQIKTVLQAAGNTKPLVLDPVAVGAITWRQKIAKELLAEFHFDVIRGNASEIAALIGAADHSHGIDAGEVTHQLQVATDCARRFQAIVILTGKTDLITDGNHYYTNPIGTNMLTVNVGSGDILASLTAAFLGTTANSWDACIVATVMVAVAGTLAAHHSPTALGSWQVQFLNQLSTMNTARLLNFIQESEGKQND